jgi:hypothetical protein
MWIDIVRMLWAFEIAPGVSEETGERTSIDPMAGNDGLVTRPVPFNAVFRPRGAWVRNVVAKECNLETFDLVKVLDQAGADRALKV